MSASMTKLSAPARRVFGAMPDGAPVELVEIANGRGMRASVITLGAGLQALTAPDRAGRFADIILGHDSVAPYVETPFYLGASIGRFSNRIAGGVFMLDGKRYDLVKSDGAHTLHGGAVGYDKVLWRIEQAGPSSVTLAYSSPDGEQGFPGALEARVTYRLTEENELAVMYEARTDALTVVGLTQHAYFNLGGADSGRTILAHRLTVDADAFTPVDAGLIPTGEIRAVAGTAFDFRQPKEVGAHLSDGDDEQLRRGRGYDHNFVLRGGRARDPKFAARLEEPVSGRVLEIFTTEPGLQFYSGNFLDGRLIGKGGAPYQRNDGLCLEPQQFPDAPNQPGFPSARLNPGETYRHLSLYRFSTAPMR
jgi:aldose 1-epimerase